MGELFAGLVFGYAMRRLIYLLRRVEKKTNNNKLFYLLLYTFYFLLKRYFTYTRSPNRTSIDVSFLSVCSLKTRCKA